MADDVTIFSPGTADPSAPAVATDDIGGKHYQKIKAGFGADGVWVETADVDGVRLPVGGAQLGALNEAAPPSDIANAGLNGRLQRIAQRLTSLIATQGPSTATDAGTVANTDQALAAAAAGTRLMGFSARETTGTAGALFQVRHGTTNSDPVLVTVSLGAGESAREWYGPDGLAAANGIWLERVTGTIHVIGYAKVLP